MCVRYMDRPVRPLDSKASSGRHQHEDSIHVSLLTNYQVCSLVEMKSVWRKYHWMQAQRWHQVSPAMTDYLLGQDRDVPGPVDSDFITSFQILARQSYRTRTYLHHCRQPYSPIDRPIALQTGP